MQSGNRLKLLYILVTLVLLISVIIDFLDGNNLKTLNTALLFAGFFLMAIFYPNTKGWRAALILTFFILSIGILIYRIYFRLL